MGGSSSFPHPLEVRVHLSRISSVVSFQTVPLAFEELLCRQKTVVAEIAKRTRQSSTYVYIRQHFSHKSKKGVSTKRSLVPITANCSEQLLLGEHKK